jgi:hypothetical protein
MYGKRRHQVAVGAVQSVQIVEAERERERERERESI